MLGLRLATEGLPLAKEVHNSTCAMSHPKEGPVDQSLTLIGPNRP